jgi:hypothetical protein
VDPRGNVPRLDPPRVGWARVYGLGVVHPHIFEQDFEYW